MPCFIPGLLLLTEQIAHCQILSLSTPLYCHESSWTVHLQMDENEMSSCQNSYSENSWLKTHDWQQDADNSVKRLSADVLYIAQYYAMQTIPLEFFWFHLLSFLLDLKPSCHSISFACRKMLLTCVTLDPPSLPEGTCLPLPDSLYRAPQRGAMYSRFKIILTCLCNVGSVWVEVTIYGFWLWNHERSNFDACSPVGLGTCIVCKYDSEVLLLYN